MLNYYQIAKQASLKIDNHPGLLYIKNQCKIRKNILDVGCGEGSRLEVLTTKFNNKFGIDMNQHAIKLAKKNYPKSSFYLGDAEKLPFKDNNFDLVYSAYTIEHTTNPERIISEMARVVKDKGVSIILAPNYGAPNRRSPNSIENPIFKIIKGFYLDLFGNRELKWKSVEPKKSYDKIDDDTTIEPYLNSLKRYLVNSGYKIHKASSLWELEDFSLNPRKLLVFLLGKFGIYPFRYWGPQLFIVFSK